MSTTSNSNSAVGPKSALALNSSQLHDIPQLHHLPLVHHFPLRSLLHTWYTTSCPIRSSTISDAVSNSANLSFRILYVIFDSRAVYCSFWVFCTSAFFSLLASTHFSIPFCCDTSQSLVQPLDNTYCSRFIAASPGVDNVAPLCHCFRNRLA